LLQWNLNQSFKKLVLFKKWALQMFDLKLGQKTRNFRSETFLFCFSVVRDYARRSHNLTHTLPWQFFNWMVKMVILSACIYLITEVILLPGTLKTPPKWKDKRVLLLFLTKFMFFWVKFDIIRNMPLVQHCNLSLIPNTVDPCVFKLQS